MLVASATSPSRVRSSIGIRVDRLVGIAGRVRRTEDVRRSRAARHGLRGSATRREAATGGDRRDSCGTSGRRSGVCAALCARSSWGLAIAVAIHSWTCPTSWRRPASMRTPDLPCCPDNARSDMSGPSTWGCAIGLGFRWGCGLLRRRRDAIASAPTEHVGIEERLRISAFEGTRTIARSLEKYLVVIFISLLGWDMIRADLEVVVQDLLFGRRGRRLEHSVIPSPASLPRDDARYLRKHLGAHSKLLSLLLRDHVVGHEEVVGGVFQILVAVIRSPHDEVDQWLNVQWDAVRGSRLGPALVHPWPRTGGRAEWL